MYSSTYIVYAVYTELYKHVKLVALVYTVDGHSFCLNLSYMHLIKLVQGCPYMGLPAKLASAKCFALFVFVDCLF